MKKTLLSIITIATSTLAFAQCNELFISEYFMGGGENHAIELFNPTGDTINLDNYVIRRYSNGSTTFTETRHMTGNKIYPVSTFTVVSGFLIPQGSLPAADTTLTGFVTHGIINGMLDSCCHSGPANAGGIMVFNGDDAITLEKWIPSSSSYQMVDIFGCIGEQPVTAWTDTPPFNTGVGTYLSRDYSLRRMAAIKQGVSVNPGPGTFNILLSYDTVSTTLLLEDYSGLGNHSCSCPTGINEVKQSNIQVNIYPNPTNSGVVMMSSKEKIESVQILNLLGETLTPVIINQNGNIFKCDVSTLKKGIYFAKVAFKNSTIITKPIIVE